MEELRAIKAIAAIVISGIFCAVGLLLIISGIYRTTTPYYGTWEAFLQIIKGIGLICIGLIIMILKQKKSTV